MIILSKNAEKLRKTTLRDRIYEEVVHLILSGELPRGGWVDEKQVIDKLRVSRTPFMGQRTSHTQCEGRKRRKARHSSSAQDPPKLFGAFRLNAILVRVFFLAQVIGARQLHVRTHSCIARCRCCYHKSTSARRTHLGRGRSCRRRSRAEL
jgi:hypothetical protein